MTNHHRRITTPPRIKGSTEPITYLSVCTCGAETGPFATTDEAKRAAHQHGSTTDQVAATRIGGLAGCDR